MSAGTALDNDGTYQLGLITIRTGTEIGIVAVLLYNHSQAPLTIDAVSLAGHGVGTVVRRVRTEIADGGPRASVPQSAYVENPPVQLTAGGCVAEALRPVAGYRLLPRKIVALWTILIAVRPGRYTIASHLITYTQDGSKYQESIPEGYHGAVARDAPLLTTAGGPEGRCWRSLHSHLLKGIPW